MKRILFSSILILGFGALIGCSPNKLMFIEESHLGLIVHASPADATAPADIDFGYRRSIVTLTPQVDAGQKDAKGKSIEPVGEVMSVISTFTSEIGWFTGTNIQTYFATGDAATKTAESPEAIKALTSPVLDTE